MHSFLEQNTESDSALDVSIVNMISSVVIFCAASIRVIVQNQCTHYYLTEASNVLHASGDDYSEIVM